MRDAGFKMNASVEAAFFSLLTFSAVLVASRSQWVWQCVYRRLYPLWDISVAMLAVCLVSTALLTIVSVGVGRSRYLSLIRTVIVFSLLHTTVAILKQIGVLPLSQIMWVRIAIAFAEFILANYFVRNIQMTIWPNIERGLCVASIIYFVSPYLIGRAMSQDVQIFPISSHETPNTALLILDELGAGAGIDIVKTLQKTGLQVASKDIEHSGADTINVIPSMMTDMSFDDAYPCGQTTVCSRGMALDFSRVKSQRTDVDVIGFYHDYCDMKGIRSCYRGDGPGSALEAATALTSLLCSFNFPQLRIDACVVPKARVWTLLVRRMEEAVFRAPFFEKGGLMYAHMPFPHPPGDSDAQTLNDAYLSRLNDAEVFLQALTTRMQQVFGDNFSIVITADHPLRIDRWCALYYKSRCTVEQRFRSHLVPFVVASPNMQSLPGLNNNKGLLKNFDY